jgi:ribonuclease VapC
VIVDTSAIAAIVFKEPGHADVLRKLVGADHAGIGTPTLAEAGIVLTARLKKDGRSLLLRFLQEFDMTPIPFGEAHWREAVEAYRRFGRGRHPAALNLGDCMTYATARLAKRPVLCVGVDFARTDVAVV